MIVSIKFTNAEINILLTGLKTLKDLQVKTAKALKGTMSMEQVNSAILMVDTLAEKLTLSQKED